MSTRNIGFSVFVNGQLVDRKTFDRPVISIGKLSTSTLKVEDVNVSRKHAVVERLDDGRWRVTDLGSTNGTVIRDERITQAFVKNGDRLVLGTTTLEVHLDETAGVASPGPTANTPSTAGRSSPAPATNVSAGANPQPAAKTALASPSKTSGEIRGLGNESFLKKRLEDVESGPPVLDVALLWGETILAARSWREPTSVVIGTGPNADFVVPEEALGTGNYTLVKGDGGKFALNLGSPRLSGDVLRGGKVESADHIRDERPNGVLTLEGACKARIRLGEFTLLIGYGPSTPLHLPPAIAEADKEPGLYLLLSAIVHISFLIVAMTIPKDMLLQSRDPRIEREKFLQMARVEPKPEEKKEEAKKPEEEDPDKKKVIDPNATEKDMAVRKTDLVVPDAKPIQRDALVDKMARVRREDLEKLPPQERAEKAREMAQQTALANTLRNSSGLMNQLMNTNPDPNQKQIAFRALGAYDPDSPGGVFADGAIDPFSGTLSQGGGGGFLADGGGPGGPGGPGGGPAVAGVFDRNGGRDLNNLNFNERPADPRVIESTPRLSGELDAKTVQQYIRRYLPGIKWCYQDRLQQNRKLAGKLTLAFTILPAGNVHNAQTANSTMGDSVLEECIRNKMTRWKFPSPKDGGVVEVAYPLILKSQ